MILTDADCGFCQRAAGHVRRLGVRLDIRTAQAEDLVALGVDPERAMLEMAWVGRPGAVDPDVRYGAPAWAAALRTGPIVWRAVGTVMDLPGLRVVAAAFYRLVARNRHRLPGGTATCQL